MRLSHLKMTTRVIHVGKKHLFFKECLAEIRPCQNLILGNIKYFLLSCHTDNLSPLLHFIILIPRSIHNTLNNLRDNVIGNILLLGNTIFHHIM